MLWRFDFWPTLLKAPVDMFSSSLEAAKSCPKDDLFPALIFARTRRGILRLRTHVSILLVLCTPLYRSLRSLSLQCDGTKEKPITIQGPKGGSPAIIKGSGKSGTCIEINHDYHILDVRKAPEMETVFHMSI